MKHVLQLVLFLYAFYTGLSRISDYKHHCKFFDLETNKIVKFFFQGSDVLAGSVLGIVVALVVGFGVTDVFETRKYQSEKLPLRA